MLHVMMLQVAEYLGEGLYTCDDLQVALYTCDDVTGGRVPGRGVVHM